MSIPGLSLGWTEKYLCAILRAPEYPQGSRWEGYPHYCTPINWDIWIDSNLWMSGITADEKELLHFNGYWSDVNQNGLPEFAVYYQYCPNACWNWGAVDTHFFEIQDASTIVDITANLKGVVLPWNIHHSRDGLEINVYDPTNEYEIGRWIHTSWIYAWDGTEYIDGTANHAAEYMAQVEQITAAIRAQYGNPVRTPRIDFLEILVLSDKASLPRENIMEIFLEITDLSNWPGTEQYDGCWVQLARANAQLDYQKEQPFSVPPNWWDLSIVGYEHWPNPNLLHEIVQQGMDVSKCDEAGQFFNEELQSE